MGLAIIIPDVSFSQANIGQVTPSQIIPITGLAISGPSSVVGNTDAAIFTPVYTPVSTSQRSVQWSVVSGGTSASINASTGALTILPGASNASVTIRVTSLADNTIFAEKTISVTYSGSGFIPLENLTARLNFSQNSGGFLTDIVPQPGDWFKAKVAMLVNRQSAFFGSRALRNADQDSVIFERDNTGIAYYSMTGKMYGTKYVSAQVMALNTRYVVELKPSGVQSDPSVGTFATSTYDYTQAPALGIGCLQLADGTKFYNNGGFDVFGIEIYDSNNVLKHRLIPQQDLTFLDEVTDVVYNPDTTTGILYGDD